jgi:GT2 family glycosyltransferase
MIDGEFPDVHVVKGNGSWWYTKSMNKGFRQVEKLDVDYILTMNDDCHIEDGFIKTLVNASKMAGADSIVGSISFTLERPHRLFFSGTKRINWRFYNSEPYHKFLAPCDPEKLYGLHPTVDLPGRGMFMPVYTLRKLNYFDEAFPQYGSDTDFCLRALQQNINVYVSWDSRIFMKAERTGSGSAFVSQPFRAFLKSFLDKYSRTYVKKEMLMLWRHGSRLFLPLALTICIRKRFTDYIFGPKVV